MKKINILMVEDEPETRETIRIFIEKSNSKSPDMQINIVGEAKSYASAEACITNLAGTENEVELILLDNSLIGYKKGLDLSRTYPRLAYILITDDPVARRQALADKHLYKYMAQMDEGTGLSDGGLISAIRTYAEQLT